MLDLLKKVTTWGNGKTDSKVIEAALAAAAVVVAVGVAVSISKSKTNPFRRGPPF